MFYMSERSSIALLAWNLTETEKLHAIFFETGTAFWEFLRKL